MRLSRARRRSAIVILLVIALVGSAMPFAAVAGAANRARNVDCAGLSSMNSSLIPVSLAGKSLTPGLFSDAFDAAARFTNQSASINHHNQIPAMVYPELPAPGAKSEVFANQLSHNQVKRIGYGHRAAINPARALASAIMPQAGGDPNAITGGAVVRHAITINTSRVEGSVRQLLGEDMILNSGAVVTGDSSFRALHR